MSIAVFGARGQVGRSVVAELAEFGTHGFGSSDCDIADLDAVMKTLENVGPDVIVNCAAMTAVDLCEIEVDRAFAVNAIGPRNLAIAARRFNARLVHVSTDYVFDGTLGRPYDEWDTPNPLGVYGRSKRGGEIEVATIAPPGWSVVRTGVVFSTKAPNFVLAIRNAAAKIDGPIEVVSDQIGSPTYAPHLATGLAALVRRGVSGLFHAAGHGSCSRADLARAILADAGDDPDRIVDIDTAATIDRYPAPRPAFAALECRAWRLAGLDPLPHWRDGLAALGAELADSVEASVSPDG